MDFLVSNKQCRVSRLSKEDLQRITFSFDVSSFLSQVLVWRGLWASLSASISSNYVLVGSKSGSNKKYKFKQQFKFKQQVTTIAEKYREKKFCRILRIFPSNSNGIQQLGLQNLIRWGNLRGKSRIPALVIQISHVSNTSCLSQNVHI